MKRIMPTVVLIFLFRIINSQDATVIYRNSVNSTVTIETNLGLGSGFLIRENIIVTNYHVIEGASEVFCYTSNSTTKFKIEGYLAVDKSTDLILLKVSGINQPALKTSSNSIAPGQKIYVLGSPKGLPATISDGIISGLRNIEGNKLIQITAPISPGSSGGPVLNSSGELIGISVGQFSGGQNLNFAIPYSSLELLLNSMKTSPLSFATLYNPVSYFIDVRDGNSYKTVTIGTQTWMAENYNFATSNGSVCYNNDPLNCSRYGRLYTWETAKMICPTSEGWQLPTDKDWQTLLNYLGGQKIAGSKLKSRIEWENPNTDATNESGFSALPGGSYNPGCLYGSYFTGLGETANFWTVPKVSNIVPDTLKYEAKINYTLLINNNSSEAMMCTYYAPASYSFSFNPKTVYPCDGMSYSVRCVKYFDSSK
jgi:uncharacterized protein (TIGR02145 family)